MACECIVMRETFGRSIGPVQDLRRAWVLLGLEDMPDLLKQNVPGRRDQARTDVHTVLFDLRQPGSHTPEMAPSGA